MKLTKEQQQAVDVYVINATMAVDDELQGLASASGDSAVTEEQIDRFYLALIKALMAAHYKTERRTA